MNLNELKELLELISEKDITEFELEEEGVKLRVKKSVALPAGANSSNNHAPASGPAVAPPEGPGENPGPAPAVEEETDLAYVHSPMVGTFYRSPEPGAPAFVNAGDRVKPGQVLCIIEAMKLMNEIESEHAGEIVRIFVENGSPVQFGDRLFSIRVAH